MHQMQEVVAAKWMPVEEYSQLEFVQSRATLTTLAKCMTSFAAGTYSGYQAVKKQNSNGRRPDLLVYNSSIESVMPPGWENN